MAKRRRRSKEPMVQVGPAAPESSGAWPLKKARRRGCKKSTRVVAWTRHYCNGGLHLVGLTDRGQLVFPSHTSKDLVREVALMAFSATGCKCAAVYYDWVRGLKSANVPEALARKRSAWNSSYGERGPVRPAPYALVAHREGIRRSRNRGAAPVAEPPNLLGTYMRKEVNPHNRYATTTVQADGLSEQAAELCARAVADVLTAWGWKKVSVKDGVVLVEMPRAPGLAYDKKDPYKHGVAVCRFAHAGATRLVRISFGSRGPADVRLTEGDAQSWDLRDVAERAEVAALAEIVYRRNEGVHHLAVSSRTRRQEKLKDLMTKLLSSMTGARVDSDVSVWGNQADESTSCNVSFGACDLTPETTVRVISTVAELALPKIMKYVAAGDRRAEQRGIIVAGHALQSVWTGSPAKDHRERFHGQP